MPRLEGVSFAYPQAPLLLNDIKLDLGHGDRLVIIGRNGSGKSTLLRILAGLLQPTAGNVTWSEREDIRGVALLQQTPENQILATSVERELAFGLENQGLPALSIRRRVDEVTELTGLQSLLYRNPAYLSGGEMQRVAFASIYAMEPGFYLFDEPASFLDPWERDRLHRMISLLSDETGWVMTASHQSRWIAGARTLELHEGRLREYSPGFFNASGSAASRSATQPPALSTHSQSVATTLDVQHLNVKRGELFGKKQAVLENVNIQVKPGEAIALVGKGGAGKSTLLEAMAGLIKIDAGKILWNGNLNPASLHGRIGIAFQFPERMFFEGSVLDEIAYGPLNLGMDRNSAEQLASDSLARCGLNPVEFLPRNPFTLSMGEARRVAFACLLAMNPIAWLLDEPTAGLDEDGREIIEKLILEEVAEGKPVIVAGHDWDWMKRWASRWIHLESGGVQFDGNPHDWSVEP